MAKKKAKSHAGIDKVTGQGPFPALFPTGNAKVGDKVIFMSPDFRVKEEGKTWGKKYGHVHQVGFRNDYGYPLKIEIKLERERRHRFVYPTGLFWGRAGYICLVRPPVEEPPAIVQEWLNKNPMVIAYRDGGNNNENRYEFACTKCWSRLSTRQATVEISDFQFHRNEFCEGKPAIDDYEEDIQCDCVDRYEEPEGGWTRFI